MINENINGWKITYHGNNPIAGRWVAKRFVTTMNAATKEEIIKLAQDNKHWWQR